MPDDYGLARAESAWLRVPDNEKPEEPEYNGYDAADLDYEDIWE